MKTNETAQPGVDGAFLRALQEHRQGEVLTNLSEAMRQAVEAARKHGKTASLTLNVQFAPNAANAIAFTAEVTTKLPKELPFAGIFFSDEQGNLYRNDPLQQELPKLKTIAPEQAPAELRQAANE
jgi:hypothetical protein